MEPVKSYGEYGNTERRPCRFAVRQYSDGTWIVALETGKEELNVLKGGILALELPDGATRKNALELMEFLNQRVEGISFTHLPSNP